MRILAAILLGMSFLVTGFNPAHAEESAPPQTFVDVRLRISPVFTEANMPAGLNVVDLKLAVGLWLHFVIEYGMAFTSHGHSDSTLAHTIMLGGRYRLLDFRDGIGTGFVIDSALLGGYSRFQDEWYDGFLSAIGALGLRLDVELLYWLTGNVGAGLCLSGAVLFPLYLENEDESSSDPYGGGGIALVLAVGF